MHHFNTSPMGYHNRYGRSYPGGYFEHAPLAISGRDPDLKGGGILFWAYSIAEANEAFDAYRAAGYNRVAIENALDFEDSWELALAEVKAHRDNTGT